MSALVPDAPNRGGSSPFPVVRALIGGIVDYAGLFPPSSLAMREAVRNFAHYHDGDDAWALGRFILPAARLSEFEAAAPLLPRWPGAAPWRLSALLGHTVSDELAAIRSFNDRHLDAESGGAAIVDAVEAKAGSVGEIGGLLATVPRSLEAFIELPLTGDVGALVAAVGRGGGRAKVRTGGVTADAFPSSHALARFLEACVAEGVPFKATAGLHHPLRAEYRLTYEDGAESAPMYGFLNVFLAAALLSGGMPASQVPALLEERSADAVRVRDNTIEWRSYFLTTEQAAAARASFALSFGSCSFSEPIDDLKAMQLL